MTDFDLALQEARFARNRVSWLEARDGVKEAGGVDDAQEAYKSLNELVDKFAEAKADG